MDHKSVSDKWPLTLGLPSTRAGRRTDIIKPGYPGLEAVKPANPEFLKKPPGLHSLVMLLYHTILSTQHCIPYETTDLLINNFSLAYHSVYSKSLQPAILLLSIVIIVRIFYYTIMFMAPGLEADPGRNGQTISKKIATCYNSHWWMPTDSGRPELAGNHWYGT